MREVFERIEILKQAGFVDENDAESLKNVLHSLSMSVVLQNLTSILALSLPTLPLLLKEMSRKKKSLLSISRHWKRCMQVPYSQKQIV